MHTEPQPIEPLENVIYISAGWTSNIALTCTPAAFLPSPLLLLPHLQAHFYLSIYLF